MIQLQILRKLRDNPAAARSIDYALKAALVLTVVMIPFKPIWGSYAILLLAAVALANAIYERKWEGLQPVAYALIVIYLVRVIWLIGAEDMSSALRKLETASPLIGLPVIFSMFALTSDRQRLTIRTYIMMCLGLMAYSFVQLGIYLQTSPYGFWEYTLFHLEPEWFWETSRYFSFYMLNWDYAHYSFISIILIYGMHLAVYLEKKTRFDKFVAVGYVVTFVIFQIYSGARVGLMAFIVALAIYAAFSINAVLRRKLVFTSLIGVSVLVIAFGMIRWGAQLDHKRHVYAAYAITAWKQRPIFGHGTDAGQVILNDPAIEREAGEVVNHPHNQFLNELLEYGIVGAIPLVAFITLTFAHGFNYQDKALLAVLITGVIFMLTESPLNSNKGIVPLVLVTSLLINKRTNNK